MGKNKLLELSQSSEMMWSKGKKMTFRFFFCYLVLYTFSTQFILLDLPNLLWQQIVPWFYQTTFGFDKIPVYEANGSGDTLYNYLLLLFFLLISVFISAIWTLIDSGRQHYNNLLNWLIVLVRYYLIFQLVNYGMSKVLLVQFAPPNDFRLSQRVGDLSPMALVWTFVGYSKGFTMLTGFLQLSSAFILLFRRTRTLGAILGLVVFGFIVPLNMFYDIPVKLLSLHLLAMSIFLVSLDGKRLLNVLILNKPTEPFEYKPLFSNPLIIKLKNITKWLAVASVFVIGFSFRYAIKQELENADLNTFEGVTFEITENLGPSDCRNIESIKILDGDLANIESCYGQKEVCFITANPKSGQCFIKTKQGKQQFQTRNKGNEQIDTLNYQFTNGEILVSGMFKSDSIKVKCVRKKENKFKLTSYQFRWINEYPDNQ